MTDLPEPYTTVGSLLGNIGTFTAKGFGLRRGDPLFTDTQMIEYRNAALEEAIDKALIALLGADRSLAVRVTAAIQSLKEQK